MAQPKVNLTELAKTSGGTRRAAAETPVFEQAASTTAPPRKEHRNPPITFLQQPLQVRQLLKMLSVERDLTMENLAGEAFNDLFAKYGKPEIAVVKPRKDRA